MRLESLHCDKCGGTLEVPAEVDFFTCNFCGSRLHVRRGTGGVWTELLAEIGRRQEEIDRRAARLRGFHDVRRIDREWEQEKKKLLTDRGGPIVPEAWRNSPWFVICSAAAAVAVVIFVSLLFSWEVAAALCGVLGVILWFGRGIQAAIEKADRYKAAQSQYEYRRQVALGCGQAPPPRPRAEPRRTSDLDPPVPTAAPDASAQEAAPGREDEKGTLILSCCNCGSPLEPPGGATVVSCGHCGGQLAVRRTRSATYTARIEAARRQADELAEESAQLAVKVELARIDAQWDNECKTLLVKRVTERDVPTRSAFLVLGVPLGLLGCFLLTAGWFQEPDFGWYKSLLGLLIVAASAGVVVFGYKKAAAYERAHAVYLRRRASFQVEDSAEGAQS